MKKCCKPWMDGNKCNGTSLYVLGEKNVDSFHLTLMSPILPQTPPHPLSTLDTSFLCNFHSTVTTRPSPLLPSSSLSIWVANSASATERRAKILTKDDQWVKCHDRITKYTRCERDGIVVSVNGKNELDNRTYVTHSLPLLAA